MKASTTFWTLLPLVLTSLPARSQRTWDQVKNANDVVPNKFIIEVDTDAHIPNKRAFARDLDAVYASIKARDVDFEVVQEFDEPGLFVGASIKLDSPEAAEELESLPGIQAIRPVRIFEALKPVSQHIVKDPSDPKLPPFNKAPHVVTSADRVHARGILGKGVKVAILDTGVDYTHPALGGGYGPGHKVIGGHDFVGDDFYPGGTPQPDDDPNDCDGHGTHVAGIVAMSPNNVYNVTGVAPEASILAYRVFGCSAQTEDDIILTAMLRAVADGADIISMSLSYFSGWSLAASSVVADRIARSGKVVVASAGNSGSVGAWYTGDPATGANVISVGSIETPTVPYRRAELHGVEREGPVYASLSPVASGTWPIYLSSNDTSVLEDGCYGLPEGTPDLTGYITLFRAGGCDPWVKVSSAYPYGGRYALVYDDGTGEVFTSDLPSQAEAAAITAADGEFLVKEIVEGVPIQISFPTDGPVVSWPNPGGSLMSDFSSYGPSADMLLKPALSAPGGDILSTYLTSQGGWTLLSGTSMSAPFVAGAAALYLEAKGRSATNARRARDAFETTSRAIRSAEDPNSVPQTAIQAGTGLLNVYDALFSETVVTPGELLLNDTANFKGSHQISITNNGRRSKTYKLTHVAAGTALTAESDATIGNGRDGVPLVNQFATASITPDEITVRPGQTRQVSVRITPPTGVERSRYPAYSGAIVATSGSESHRVTYLGLAASLKDRSILDPSFNFFFQTTLPAVVNYLDFESPQVPTNYTWVNDDIFVIPYSLAFSTRRLRIDLVSPDFQLGAIAPRDEPRAHAVSFPRRTRPGSFAKVPTVGPLYEGEYLARDYGFFNFRVHFVEEPKFANGTLVPRGAYKVLLRALKMSGNPDRQEDYETWLSPILVGFNYP